MDAGIIRSLSSWMGSVVERASSQRLLLFVTGCLVFGFNLGATRLWDVDEAIFSAAAVEMSDRGDWVTPYYNGHLFAHKPPFMYWCQIAAFEVFGRTEFAARLSSGLFGIGTLILTYEIGRTLFCSRVGLWAGLALAGCVNFSVIARAATPDAHLTFFSTLALFFLIRGEGGKSARHASTSSPWRPDLSFKWQPYALSYVAMGIGTLVKGPVAIVIPMAVWGMFLLIEQQQANAPQPSMDSARTSHDEITFPNWRATFQSVAWLLWLFRPTYFLQTVWRMRPLTGLLVLLLTAGPWYALVGWRTNGEFLREFFLVQNVGRATQAMEHHHGPVFYYLVTICIGTFPWCILLWPAIKQCCRCILSHSDSRASYVLLACWVLVWVGCFSILATKLSSYVIPAFPAIAICFGAVIEEWLRKENQAEFRRWMQRGWITCASVGVGCLIAIPIATRIYCDGEYLPALIGFVPLTGAAIGSRLTASGCRLGAFATLATMSVMFCAGLMGLAVLPIDAHKNTHHIAQTIRQRTTGVPYLLTYKYSPPSLVFYSGWCFERLRNRDQVRQHFLEGRKETFLVTTERQLTELRSFLPADCHVIGCGRLFLKPERVVIVFPRTTHAELRESDDASSRLSPLLAN